MLNGLLVREKFGLRQLICISCILLVVLMTGVEATHSHSDAVNPRASSHCAICISVHANAPAMTSYSLPVLAAVEVLFVAPQIQSKASFAELELFIRPPPIV